MAKSEKTSGAPSKRSRRSTAHLTKTVSIRFSEDELSAVEEVRKALAADRGCDLDKVSLSEAVRLLVLDKEEAADIEARAKVISEGQASALMTNRTFDEGFENVAESLAAIQLQLRRIGVNLNQLARRGNSGEKVVHEEISDALELLSTIPIQIELAEGSFYENYTLVA